MARRHRAEPVRRPLPRLPRPVVAGGVAVGVALLGVALAATFRPDPGSGPATRAVAVAVADDGRQDAAMALREEEQRTSRNRTRSPEPTTPAAPSRSVPAVPTVAAPSASKPPAKRATPGVSDAPCPLSSGLEAHLTTHARAVYRAVCAAFRGSVSSFGGYRAGDSGDHGSGKAVDIMVSGQPGWGIAHYVQAHARELGVTYVIFQQKIWLAGNPTSQWTAMEDRGSITANHFDHVHVSVS